MLRAIATLLILTFAVPVAGCIVEGPGRPGWCANHPYRCR